MVKIINFFVFDETMKGWRRVYCGQYQLNYQEFSMGKVSESDIVTYFPSRLQIFQSKMMADDYQRPFSI